LLVFIPFVGTLVGAITSIALALMQFDTWAPTIIIAAIFTVGSILEGYVLQPWLVGDRVGLHPVWIIFALLAGGVIFGFVGILLAVPVTAVIGVLCRFGLSRYLASALYAPPGLDGERHESVLAPEEPV
jgi:predicted PurR-regulated permease PerM